MISGFIVLILTSSKRQCFYLVYAISRNWNDLESTNHCKRMHFQKSELMFRVTFNGKSGVNKV